MNFVKLDKSLSDILDIYISSQEYNRLLFLNEPAEFRTHVILLDDENIKKTGIEEIHFEYYILSDKMLDYNLNLSVTSQILYKNMSIYKLELVGNMDLLVNYRDYVKYDCFQLIINSYNISLDDSIQKFRLDEICCKNVEVKDFNHMFNLLLKSDLLDFKLYIEDTFDYSFRCCLCKMENLDLDNKLDELSIHYQTYFTDLVLKMIEDMSVLHNTYDKIYFECLLLNITNYLLFRYETLYKVKEVCDSSNIYLKVYVDDKMYLRLDNFKLNVFNKFKEVMGNRLELIELKGENNV